MEIRKARREPITFSVEGAKFTFAPSSHRDVLYAVNIVQSYLTRGAKITPVDRVACTEYVLSRLTSIEGVKYDGVELSVKRLQELAPEIEAGSLAPILNTWGLEVYASEGLLKPEVEQKKDLTPESDSRESSTQSSINQGSIVEGAQATS